MRAVVTPQDKLFPREVHGREEEHRLDALAKVYVGR
jgi:hypothetical protein